MAEKNDGEREQEQDVRMELENDNCNSNDKESADIKETESPAVAKKQVNAKTAKVSSPTTKSLKEEEDNEDDERGEDDNNEEKEEEEDDLETQRAKAKGQIILIKKKAVYFQEGFSLNIGNKFVTVSNMLCCDTRTHSLFPLVPVPQVIGSVPKADYDNGNFFRKDYIKVMQDQKAKQAAAKPTYVVAVLIVLAIANCCLFANERTNRFCLLCNTVQYSFGCCSSTHWFQSAIQRC